eukprot:CAMPEP_0175451616 /NCGR_PEP_ID=MMETSP0095-20121207/62986_1 /TAXON_ID=311494 /ORGANISM="Alexandrium monilatum, Strain CCMP3105" /LENGTH=154 /DNA_ID=CAMNT_0016752143 /DNA_START=45 /DNA_END=505 /DNA_ORIENTATION=+
MAGPARLIVSGCAHKTIDKILNGTFVPNGERNHGLPVFKKTEKVSGLDIMLYYWDERDGPACSGWWFGPQVGGDQVWGYHSQRGYGAPPITGWKVPCDGAVDPNFRVTVPAPPVPAAQAAQAPPQAQQGYPTYQQPYQTQQHAHQMPQQAHQMS